MKTIFISDVHLSPNCPEILQAFLDFLSQQSKTSVEALYILGDLFEAYVGDDEPGLIQTVAASLKEMSLVTSAKVYLMQGNRDFLMGKSFAKLCGATLLPDPCVIDLYGEKTLLTHGDKFCTKDRSYQWYRRVIQHPFFKWLVLKTSLGFRRKIARYLRRKSKMHVQHYRYSDKMDVSPDAVKAAALKHHIKQIIHGHTHKPAFHEEEGLKRWVLPDWRPLGGLLCVASDASPQLVVRDKIRL